LFCFDFSGSGHSDGEYVSLGFYERDDLAVVIEHLRQSGTVGCIGLWGRSMGAATALLHGDRDPSIAGMVLDSPFTSLRSLAEELVDVFIGVSLPKWVVSLAMNMIRSTIKGKARFDINDLSPISHVDKTYIPALFVAAEHDSFIRPDHARKLYTTYAGDKNLVIVDGDHNTARPRFFLDSVAIFFHNTLQCPEDAPFPDKTTDNPSTVPPRIIPDSSVIMRPPDRGEIGMMNSEEDEDFMIQKAIEESLRHVAAETTPADSIRREKSK